MPDPRPIPAEAVTSDIDDLDDTLPPLPLSDVSDYEHDRLRDERDLADEDPFTRADDYEDEVRNQMGGGRGL